MNAPEAGQLVTTYLGHILDQYAGRAAAFSSSRATVFVVKRGGAMAFDLAGWR